MSGSDQVGRDAGAVPPTVFFLSDYGLADEFVGVVHAVVRKVAPQAMVIDLTHGVPPFDVRAGAAALARAVPHLGPGVVLAVVDPGVGGERRAVVVEGGPAGGPRWFVGPDNGLLVSAAELGGGIRAVWDLQRPRGAAATFDGRDVFAPAAAMLSAGAAPASLGRLLRVAELRRLPPFLAGREPDGGRSLRAGVSWVDRFGNVQLTAPGSSLPTPEDGPGGTAAARTGAEVVVAVTPAAPGTAGPARGAGHDSGAGEHAGLRARWVRTFSELAPGALGLLTDANGQLALVVCEGSAAAVTGAGPGDVVDLAW